MNAQEIFDKVVAHLRQQGEASAEIDEETADVYCRYRAVSSTGKHLMCAAGCLIPDEIYDAKNMEGRRWGSISTDYPELRKLEAHFVLIEALQKAHDGAANHPYKPFMKQLELCLQYIAEDFSLEYTAP